MVGVLVINGLAPFLFRWKFAVFFPCPGVARFAYQEKFCHQSKTLYLLGRGGYYGGFSLLIVVKRSRESVIKNECHAKEQVVSLFTILIYYT